MSEHVKPTLEGAFNALKAGLCSETLIEIPATAFTTDDYATYCDRVIPSLESGVEDMKSKLETIERSLKSFIEVACPQ